MIAKDNSKINSVFEDLFSDDKEFVEAVKTALTDNAELSSKMCEFVKSRAGADQVVKFENLANEIKTHACLDYLAIGIISGKIKKEEVLALIK